ncbi:Por secretion system C-terminal sorting domain-containing protein [Flavobacterium succinicans]|uniref:Por secretion system C-terminal sorting domain-containing protein n=1 Tax=Flavobacterium succinicans TaxID=29536 RepID=A0A1I4XZN5_9FLAO|nr:SMP-30/gluconolactonase/LRE family protein [Flavobacterium succinicans]SFN31284.1 Por secretion system C-terminal sorting domain-containing protein [Flavobacterium succinicans]
MNLNIDNNLKKIFPFLSYLYFFYTNAQTVTTFAGSTEGLADGTGTAAKFYVPNGVAVDDAGNVFVADTRNSRIRKITANGVVTTWTEAAPRFFYPYGVAVNAVGNVFATDIYYKHISKIADNGVISVLLSNSTSGQTIHLDTPYGVAVDASENVYVADRNNNRILKITPTREVTILAGGSVGTSDGTGTSAQFNYPNGLAIDGAGNVFVADTSNGRIRKITPEGVVTTLAGDDTGTAAHFKSPNGVAVDNAGNVYVADTGNNRIQKISANGVVTTLAGGSQGFADGTGTAARFSNPSGVAIASDGTIFVADTGNNRIRKITNTLATANFQLENQVLLHPNPASNLINIELEDITASKIVILDMNGRKHKSVNILDKKTVINISNLVSGIYLIQITTDKGIVSKKIVKE